VAYAEQGEAFGAAGTNLMGARDADGFLQYETVQVELEDGTPLTMVAGLRTDEAVSEAVSANQVLTSILLFGAVYLLLGVLWLFILDKKIKTGPQLPGTAPEVQS
jgi:hypothetical protein